MPTKKATDKDMTVASSRNAPRPMNLSKHPAPPKKKKGK